jgi:hypothetical protein
MGHRSSPYQWQHEQEPGLVESTAPVSNVRLSYTLSITCAENANPANWGTTQLRICVPSHMWASTCGVGLRRPSVVDAETRNVQLGQVRPSLRVLLLRELEIPSPIKLFRQTAYVRTKTHPKLSACASPTFRVTRSYSVQIR